MEKIVGQVTSKTSGITYRIKWDMDEQSSWIDKNGLWQQVCTRVRTADDAVSCAQGFIDGQPDLF